MACPGCSRGMPPVRVWPWLCTCGARVQADGTWEQTPQRERPPKPSRERTEEQVAELVTICAACEYWRDHQAVGGRCTHKRCGCGKGTEAVVIGEVRINAGLVDRMRRGAACPVGQWAQKESPLAGDAAGG